MKIAVVGLGVAGSAVARLLAADGHEVSAWEQAPELSRVGAGILLQPSGLEPDRPEALEAYAAARASHVAFYSRLAASLSPFFQSDGRVLGLGRDVALPAMTHVGPLRRRMLDTVAGRRSGWTGGRVELDP